MEELNYNNLNVDKEDENVRYNDEFHKYWTKNGNLNCISVTTLIHKFTTFDEEFWACYKTLERLISEEEFKQIKPQLLDKKIFKEEYYLKFNISKEDFNKEKDLLLGEWVDKREKSCIRGSEIHKKHELEHLAGNTKELQSLKLGGAFTTINDNKIKLGEKGVYPELLISRISNDGKLRVAGQADLIIIDNNDLYVLDYKTNAKIDKKSFYDKKLKKSATMKYPLNNIQDTNFWHYSLQLSTYAWMLEKKYPNLKVKLLMLIHYDHDGNCTNYECEYLKSDVERMLAYYKKQIENEEFKNKHKKINF